jgi:aquaporin PIP
MFSFLNYFNSPSSSAKSGSAYTTGYRSAGGSSLDPIADARANSARQNALRRPSAAFAVADQGFNSFRGSLSAGWKAEFVSWRFRQALLAELIATTFFVAMGTLSVMFTYKSGLLEGFATQVGYPYKLLLFMNYSITRFMSISLSFGLTLCALVFATGAISGANMNPAVSVSLWLTGKMSALRCFFYILMQCAGAVFGSFFARSVSPTLFSSVGGAANVINPSGDPRIGLGTVLGGEVIGTALLVFTISAAADAGRERSNRYVGALTPLMIGFSVTLVHFFLIPIDNCSINPARSLGSAVVQGGKQAWNDHWVFWAGPLVGGPFSALLYEFVFSAMATSTANADDTKDKTARNELLELAASASAAEDVIQRVPSIDGEQVSSMSSVVTEREAMSIHSVVPQVAVLQTASIASLNEAKSFPQTLAQIPEREPSAINYIPIQKPLSPVREITEIPLQAAFIAVDRDAQQELPPTYTYSADDSFDASGPPPMSEEESRKYD